MANLELKFTGKGKTHAPKTQRMHYPHLMHYLTHPDESEPG